MADYQRILSYLYRYEKAEKKECLGFVKAEQKSGSLKLTIQIDDERLLQGMELKLCFYERQGESWQVWQMDTVTAQEHKEELHLTYPADALPKGFRIKGQSGVLLYYQDGFYYGTVWIGEEIPTEVLEPLRWHKVGNSAESDPETEEKDSQKNISGEKTESQKESGKNNSSEVSENQTEIEESVSDRKLENQAKIEGNVSDEKLENQTEMKENISGERLANQIEVEENIASKLPKEQKVSAKDISSELLEESKKSIEGISVRMSEEQTEPAGNISSEMLEEQTEAEEDISQKNIEEISLERENILEKNSQISTEEFEIEESSGKAPYRDSEKRMERLNQKENLSDAENGAIDNNSVNIEDVDKTIEPEAKLETESKIRAESLVDDFEKMWINSAKEKPPVDNIFNTAFYEGCKVSAAELEQFGEEAGALKSNQFLLKGYERYRHLLAGKVRYAGEKRYCIGVPGIYENREKYMAGIYQFPVFLSLTENRMKTGSFGYWLYLLQDRG